jgi:hypothetical protein
MAGYVRLMPSSDRELGSDATARRTKASRRLMTEHDRFRELVRQIGRALGGASVQTHQSDIALDQVPVTANIGQRRLSGDLGAVHGPERRQAAVVLPENIGLAVAVEIGRGRDMPRRSDIIG